MCQQTHQGVEAGRRHLDGVQGYLEAWQQRPLVDLLQAPVLFPFSPAAPPPFLVAGTGGLGRGLLSQSWGEPGPGLGVVAFQIVVAAVELVAVGELSAVAGCPYALGASTGHVEAPPPFAAAEGHTSVVRLCTGEAPSSGVGRNPATPWVPRAAECHGSGVGEGGPAPSGSAPSCYADIQGQVARPVYAGPDAEARFRIRCRDPCTQGRDLCPACRHRASAAAWNPEKDRSPAAASLVAAGSNRVEAAACSASTKSCNPVSAAETIAACT